MQADGLKQIIESIFLMVGDGILKHTKCLTFSI